eukprot:gnl/TRDRNA2_/TRDRNA2_81309_c0_seq1.p1 gnl/TRDRNA2_/TRDRNA2_81309_c0~~gnl/TRDRNA2_/TRDRNA2_81309_c0_seq1.p1  ORF type:complete len:492 (+),score=47.93 gnl/TRDRNA2_/TRDRNA2_81309_c0_seq1:19-1494(+)
MTSPYLRILLVWSTWLSPCTYALRLFKPMPNEQEVAMLEVRDVRESSGWISHWGRLATEADARKQRVAILISMLEGRHLETVDEVSQFDGFNNFNSFLFSRSNAWLTLPIVLVSGLAIFQTASWIGPCMPPRSVPYVVCGIYIVVSLSVDIAVAMQKRIKPHGSLESFSFNPVCVVVIAEALKTICSVMLYMVSRVRCRCHEGRKEPVALDFSTLSDVKWLVPPAFLYTVHNVLLFVAIGTNDMSQFAVFRDATMILWAANIWRVVFRVRLGWMRFNALAVIIVGLVLDEVTMMRNSKGGACIGFLWIVAMTLSNACGAVANEYALKQSIGLDINILNAFLYFFSFLIVAMFLVFTDPVKLSSASNFTAGFDRLTYFTVGIQAIVGLIVSRILKHADAVMKTVATCLRGPVLVAVAPLFVTSTRSLAACVLSLVVAGGCLIYLTCGPLPRAPEKLEKAEMHHATRDLRLPPSPTMSGTHADEALSPSTGEK